MKALPLEKVELGMKLAQDVMTPKGQVLLKAGIVIDDYYISIFKKYNVDFVVVSSNDGEQKDMTEEERNLLLQQIRPLKKKIFRDCIEDPIMYELYEAVVQNAVWEKWNEDQE